MFHCRLYRVIEQNGSALDIERQMRKLYAKANSLVSFFQSFYANLYCCQFRYDDKRGVTRNYELRTLTVFWDKWDFRNISASEMLVVHSVVSFGDKLRKPILL